MSTTTFAYDHRVIDLPRVEYYQVSEETPAYTKSLTRKLEFLRYLSILILRLFVEVQLPTIDLTITICHITLTVDCYCIQIEYYVWELLLDWTYRLMYGNTSSKTCY